MALRTLRRFAFDSDAQGVMEYAIIIALVALVGLLALKALGSSGNNSLTNAGNQLS